MLPPIDEHGHIPVLMAPILEHLAPAPGEVVVDCTAGLGGHAAALGERISPDGRIMLMDVDATTLGRAADRVRPIVPDVTAVHDSFVRVAPHLQAADLRADVVLADLGFSSVQMDDPRRGFSFSADGPLDMRLNPELEMTAADLLATLTEPELADVIYEHGEEPLARKIARKVAQTRERWPIQTTAELARLVVEAYGRRALTSRQHPATRTFMALRIAVNDELGALSRWLESVTLGAERIADDGWLQPGARIGVISFHSLEDRLVKRAFAEIVSRGLGSHVGRRPMTADETERHQNPRARSAKLRVVRMTTPNTQDSQGR